MAEIANLDAVVIEEEFVTIASYTDIVYNKFQAPLIGFEGFCVLMERLETLGERRSVFEVSHAHTTPPYNNSSSSSSSSSSSVSSGSGRRRRYSVSAVDLTSDMSPLPENLDEGDAGVPKELVEGYQTLIAVTKTAGGHHAAGEEGVSLAAILLWDNIQVCYGVLFV
jgi:hypothetical protein